MFLGLGTSFFRAAQRWPSLLWTVLARREAQRERLAVQGLIGYFPRAQTRVLLMLWHLAQSGGRVTPEGVVVPLALTHALLGELTGARRSTVTLAVSALESEGLIHRARTGFWVISAAGQRVARALVEPAASTPTMPVGDGELLRERARENMRDARALRAQARQTGANSPHGQGHPLPGPTRALGAVADVDGVTDTAARQDAATDRTAPAKRARRAAEDAGQGAGRARERAALAAGVADAVRTTSGRDSDTDRRGQARERTVSAAESARTARERAACAHGRASEMYGDTARRLARAADVAEELGDAASAARHRELAAAALEEAKHTSA